MQTIGKILGGLGLLALLSSPITFLITGDSLSAGIKAIVGVALMGAYVATNYQKLLNADARPNERGDGKKAMPQSARASFFYLSTLLMALVTIGALGAANFIAAKRNKTWDLTRKKIFSLAPQTLQALEDLKEPVKAIALLEPGDRDRDLFESLFKKYAAASDKFTYELKDPKKHPDLAAKYQLREWEAPVVLLRGSGEKESHTTLKNLSEQDLTNALLRLDKVTEQKVYFLVGHGEWPLEPDPMADAREQTASLGELKRSLQQEGYVSEPLSLAEKQNEIPRDAALLVIAGAKSKFSEPERQALRKYLDQGGRLLYFAEAHADPGLDEVLNAYGVQVDAGLVADKINPFNPYHLISAFYGDHDITKLHKQLRLQVEFPTARALSVVHTGTAEGVRALPVVTSSPYAWVETDLENEPSPSSGEKAGAVPLVVATSRPTSNAADKRHDEARVVVFGDSELLVDANWGHDGNRNLVMNALGWMTEQSNKVTIRPPDRDISTVDLTPDTLSKIRLVAMDLLPLSLVGVGLAIWLARRSK